MYIFSLTVIIARCLTMCFTIVLPCHAMKARLTYLYKVFNPIPKKPQADHLVKQLGMPQNRAPPRK